MESFIIFAAFFTGVVIVPTVAVCIIGKKIMGGDDNGEDK